MREHRIVQIGTKFQMQHRDTSFMRKGKWIPYYIEYMGGFSGMDNECNSPDDAIKMFRDFLKIDEVIPIITTLTVD